MEPLNRVLNGLFDLLMQPCRMTSPWLGLVVVSLSSAMLFVVLFQIASNPKPLQRARNRLVARVLELLLFQHDLRVSLTACVRILASNGAYLYQFLWPMSLGLIPLALIFVQMEGWFDRRPLRVGESAVVTVIVDSPLVNTPIEIHTSEQVRVDSPAVRIPAKSEVSWRIVAIAAGTGSITITAEGRSEQKSVVTGDSLVRVSPRKVRRGWINETLAPAEPPLATISPLRQIDITYPPREITIGLHKFSWIGVVVVLMMMFSLTIARFMNIPLV